MALKIYERYEPLANPGTAEYPTGSIKNKSAPQNKDGTPIEQDWANDLLGMRDAILAAGNVQADGNVENAVNSQIVEALKAFLVESERVVQSPGSSEDDVMSQKAATDTFVHQGGDAELNDLTVGGDANFSSMPVVGGSPIVSSGETNAGSWVQYADGTMEQQGEVECKYNTDRTLTAQLLFPKEFVGDYVFTGSHTPTRELVSSGGGTTDKVAPLWLVGRVSDGGRIELKRTDHRGGWVQGDKWTVDWSVKGRWKDYEN